MKKLITETDRHLFFWDGWPSQWYPSPFVDETGAWYNCAEQYMMAQKAMAFQDIPALKLIMNDSSPRSQKATGRLVGTHNGSQPFDARFWDGICQDVVFRGNLFKFTQIPELQELLLASGSKTIVEASPVDKVWGIGLAVEDQRVNDPTQWQGTNLLGIAIERVRTVLQKGIEFRQILGCPRSLPIDGKPSQRLKEPT